MATVSNEISFGRQTLRRGVNSRIHSLIALTEPELLEIFCECGRRMCADRLHVASDLYEGVLRSRGQYVIATHHDHDPSQRLVSRHHGFVVVERWAD